MGEDDPHTALRARTRARAWISGHMRAREQLSLSPAPPPRRRTKASITYAQWKTYIHNYISTAQRSSGTRPHTLTRVGACVCQCVCTEHRPSAAPRRMTHPAACSLHTLNPMTAAAEQLDVHMSRRITYVSMHTCIIHTGAGVRDALPAFRPDHASPPRRAAPAGTRAASEYV